VAPFKNKDHPGGSVGWGLKTMGTRKILPIPARWRREQWVFLVSPMGSGRTSSGRQERTEIDSIRQTTASGSAPGRDLREQGHALRQREISTVQSEPHRGPPSIRYVTVLEELRITCNFDALTPDQGLDVGNGSFASGSGRPPLQPCPLCPESDSRPPKMRSVAMGQQQISQSLDLTAVPNLAGRF
jgi:hypothetical protein